MGANVERPTEAVVGTVLLCVSGSWALIGGIAGMALFPELGAFGLIDVSIGVLLVLSGYLISYQPRHLTAGTVIALVVGSVLTIFFAGLAEIDVGIVFEGIIPVTAGILGFVARGKSARMQKMPSDLIGVVRLHERIGISELATRFKTTELEIELSIIKLQEKGEPISFDRETREAIYRK